MYKVFETVALPKRRCQVLGFANTSTFKRVLVLRKKVYGIPFVGEIIL